MTVDEYRLAAIMESDYFERGCLLVTTARNYSFDELFSEKASKQARDILDRLKSRFPVQQTCHYYKEGHCSLTERESRDCSFIGCGCESVSLPWIEFTVLAAGCKDCRHWVVRYNVKIGVDGPYLVKQSKICQECGSSLSVKESKMIRQPEEIPGYYLELIRRYSRGADFAEYLDDVEVLCTKYFTFRMQRELCRAMTGNDRNARYLFTAFSLDIIDQWKRGMKEGEQPNMLDVAVDMLMDSLQDARTR